MDTHEQLRQQAKQLEKMAREMRRQEYQKYRDKGWTMEQIATKYKISKQRVEQILKGE